MARKNRRPAARGRFRREAPVASGLVAAGHQKALPENDQRKLKIALFANGQIIVRVARNQRTNPHHISENSRQLERAAIYRPSTLSTDEMREKRFTPCRHHSTCGCNDNWRGHEEQKRVQDEILARRRAESRDRRREASQQAAGGLS